MSAKSSKPGKTLSVPRAMIEINTEYQQLCAQLGQLEYTLAVQKATSDQIKQQLQKLNHEGAARQQLDAAKPKEETTPTEQVTQ